MPQLLMYTLLLMATLTIGILSFRPDAFMELLYRLQAFRRRRQMLLRLRDHTFSPEHAVLWRNRHKITAGRKTSRPLR